MKITTATSDANIARVPCCTVMPPSVGLMVCSAIGVLLRAAGRLPAFSVLTPGDDTDSEHNGFSMATGDNWLGHQVTAVMNGADWGSTAIFIVWDDCGCFYDQAPPGTNPDGTPQGPRVPLVIVSPYARAGFTDSTVASQPYSMLANTPRRCSACRR